MAPNNFLSFAVETTVTKRLRHGNLMAEIQVALAPDDGAWGPYISLDDVEKLERVEHALKRGYGNSIVNEAKVFEITALAGN